ncbi:DUF7527 domain-containing protein [Halorubrum laminariae]|uniref:DUF7527 domain-containing protein n=1 Tax=Halorubrum laminariae TaxID=1433523 RepID=A0ABD6C235_9EURY|nr:hypothetical protein [Halorubrum laminariae]
MDAQRRAEITEWDAREFSDGFAGLAGLVDREFSGAVTDGVAWLFVFEGRVVGVADGDLDGFADASGTVYEAPHEVLPVLFAMQERGGEPRAQYYTNDTPLSEADRKLSQGGYTGYVELSENVLSGDYYVTYTAGESMSAAYVGNSRRLETGDDAFDLADDEVGIYTVYEVDLDVRELPTGDDATSGATGDADGEVTDSGSAAAGPGAAVTEAEPTATDEVRVDAEAASNSSPGATETTPDPVVADPSADETGGDEMESDETGTEETGTEETAEVAADADGVSDSDTDDVDAVDDGNTGVDAVNDGRDADDSADADATASDADARASGSEHDTSETDRDGAGNRGSTAADAESDRSPVRSETGTDRRDRSPSDGEQSASSPADEDVFSEEEQWREQKSIPALDPSEASPPPEHDREPGATNGGENGSAEPRATEQTGSNSAAVTQRSTSRGSAAPSAERAASRIRELESALETATEARESLETERDRLAAKRDEIADERDDLAAEVEGLESELSTIREERDRLREELSAVRDRLPESDRNLSAAEAREGTNLFVRYDSKGGATLEDAHDGAVDRDSLRENLRIEHHTSFETEGLAVEGRPYEEFLRDTIEYGFTRWLVEDLPFEVSETGSQSVLRDLYDALPEIDRAEIGGSVSIAIREGGEETREQRQFDLVLRDRMGNPLFVADLNDSRDPTAEGTLESLVSNGRDIAESNDPFAAAFAVTESFFEPGALETASDAVGGGLFSRSKRASFVKLSRKRGYHLCLVEARDGGFHMTVPDL